MDRIFATWLERQHREALALSAASDSVAIDAEPGRYPASRYIARFHDAPTLVRRNGTVDRASGFAAFIQFPENYLRSVPDAAQIVNILEPDGVWHPNVVAPFICLGHIAPATGLVELIFQVYEILNFQKLTPRDDDALNGEACAWARQHMGEFPLSTAPLRRHAVEWSIAEITPRAESERPSHDHT